MSVSREHILTAVRENPDTLTRKDLARALGIKGEDRRELRAELKDMVEEGLLDLSSRKTYREASTLAPVMVLRVIEIDEQGDMIGIPEPFKGEGDPPRLIIRESRMSKKTKGHKTTTLGVEGRALCRIKQEKEGWSAQVMKKLGSGPARQLGILSRDGRGWIIRPVDKKSRHEFRARKVPENTADQSLVLFQTTTRNRREYERSAEIVDILGDTNSPKAASLISLRAHNIPVGFSDAVIQEAKALKLPKLSTFREDLRAVPLITIDPEDAKDFDDAVYAAPDAAADNQGGWVIWVAIADVAHFVTPGSTLDASAEERGNSVYLPDRVEPMLPDELSSDLCSLRPHEDRACMAVKIRFSKDGTKRDHHFTRGLMRSHARLTYAQAQEGFDGKPGAAAQPVIDTLENLFKAYQALLKARKQRAPLDIELPERRVHVNDQGEVTKVSLRERFDAHKLIEEFMVQANVAAAEALAQKGMTAIVRVHEPPAQEKLQGLSDFLPALDLKWSLGERATPKRFNHLLAQAREKDLSETIGMAVLRSQSQAFYSPDKSGHFGLNLTHYAHFTSPIRRYADLVVHRALIQAFDLGEDGTTEREATRLKEIAEHISNTERRAMAAERDAKDRYIARYLEGQVGAVFDARITGVTKFGLFITLDETGADGLIPARSLGHANAYYMFDEKKRALTNVDTGDTYRFGRQVKVRLQEADGVTGGLIFEMLTKPEKGPKPKRQNRPPRKPHHRRGRRR